MGFERSSLVVTGCGEEIPQEATDSSSLKGPVLGITVSFGFLCSERYLSILRECLLDLYAETDSLGAAHTPNTHTQTLHTHLTYTHTHAQPSLSPSNLHTHRRLSLQTD